jgi:toxin HigB-1
MIKSWKHKGLQDLFLKGSRKSIRADLTGKIKRRLDVMDSANSLEALGLPGFRLHPLKGERSSQYSIAVTGNFRIIFRFIDGDVYDVNLEDYHGK